MSIPELIDEWPALAPFFGPFNLPWQREVKSWPAPWRRWWAAISVALREEGVALEEAEHRAYLQVVESRAHPERTAGRLVGGGKAVKDAVARPKMVARKITKKDRKVAREMGGGLFDDVSDGNARSTTYGMETH